MSPLAAGEKKRLLAFFLEELSLLDAFMKLTDEQTKHLEADEIDLFRASLEDRQDIIGQIDALLPKIDGLIRSFPEEALSSDEDIAERRRNIKDALLEIRRKNAENESAALKRKDQLGEDIKKLSQSQKGLEGYAQNAPPGGSEYFDKKF